MQSVLLVAVGAISLLTAGQPVYGEASTDLFQNKQISIIIGFQPGGTYDTYSRLVANHLSRHLPGRPLVIPKNLAGAGSFKAASFVYNQAPRDGTTIGMVNEALLLDQLFAAPNMDFDMGKFNWVGRINSATNIGMIWHTAKAKTIQEATTTELITGATGIQSFSGALPRILNNVLGTKFKIVPGYGSARGLSIDLERGEIEAYFSDSTELLQLHRDWLIDKKASVPIQFGNRRHPSLPDSPTVTELGRNPEEKQVLALPASISTVGKSFIAPPELPSERLAALRLAFDALMRDPVFITEAQQRGLELDPLTGDLLQRRVQETLAVPAPIVARAAEAWKP